MRTRPVFISSTFVDMQAERDYLRTRVFPELEERLRALRYNLEWVDLRVGVATASVRDERIREMHVLKVCLDEVRRCRPFLIILLGDRYGWVPSEDRLRAAAEEAREGFSADVAGRSVTDLEIDFGVLSDPEQQSRSIFYFRRPLPYAQMPPEVAALYSDASGADPAAADRCRRLAELKQRIERELPDRVRHYAAEWDAGQQRVIGLDDWGRVVLEDIWRELQAEIGPGPIGPEAPWQQAERESLEDFIDDRARGFIGRRAIIEHLVKLSSAAGPAGGLGACVVGDPGSGKSALFGQLSRLLGSRDTIVLAHAAGASVRAASVDVMLRRWIDELAFELGTPSDVPADAAPEVVDASFAALLGRMAADRPVLLLIDALDQFEATVRAQYLTWLPRSLPPNVRLLATAIGGVASQALADRATIEIVPLPPLDAAEARDITAGICDRYHRQFEPEVVDAILAKRGPDGPAWANPLWLVLAVEELNLLDADDFARAQRDYRGEPGERLRALMIDIVSTLPGDIPGLYGYLFDRAEDLFGANFVRSFLGLIAVSRAGWRENDFRILVPNVSGEPWDRLRFAQVRRLFRGQMRRRGALDRWDFNHMQMRVAVHTRLAALEVSEQGLHATIVDRLLSCPMADPLRISETMVHLLGSEDWTRAARYYGSAELTEAENSGATVVLADRLAAAVPAEQEQTAQTIAGLLNAPGCSDTVRANAAKRFLHVNDAIRFRTSLNTQLIIADQVRLALAALVESDPDNADWQLAGSRAHEAVGYIQTQQGKAAAALESLRAGLGIVEQLARRAPRISLSLYSSETRDRIGHLLRDQGKLEQALACYQESLKEREQMAALDPEGMAAFDPSMVVIQQMLATSQANIGEVLLKQGRLQEALDCYRAGLAMEKRLAAAHPGDAVIAYHDLAASFGRIGDVLMRQRRFAQAYAYYRRAVRRFKHFTAINPTNTFGWNSLALLTERCGNALYDYGRRDKALEQFRESRKAWQVLVDRDPDNADWQYSLSVNCSLIGKFLASAGNYDEALANYQASLAIANRLVSVESGNLNRLNELALCHEKVGDVREAQGDIEGALQAYREGAAIREKLAQSDPDNAEWQNEFSMSYARIGDLHESRGGRDDALHAYGRSLAITEQLLGSHPDNEDGLIARWMLLIQVGEIHSERGDDEDAFSCFRESLAVAERLVQFAPHDLSRQHDLSLSHTKLGDMQLRQGDVAAAHACYASALAIRERLADADPSNEGRKRDAAVLFFKLAKALSEAGRRDDALAALRRGRAIMVGLTEAAPENDQWARDRSAFEARIAEIEPSATPPDMTSAPP